MTDYVPDPGAAWFVIAGDEAALSAITTIALALPPGRTAHLVVEIPTDADRIDLTSPARLITTWLPRGERAPGAALEAEVRRLHLPLGDGRIWVAAEAAVVRRIRHHLLVDRGLDPSQVEVRSHAAAGDHDRPDQERPDQDRPDH
ncbi:hypothetical protein BH10ACT1_BH10ACT1_41820 [soil metagenome]